MMHQSVVRANQVIGVSLVGVNATLTAVTVADNMKGNDFAAPGGMAVSGCDARASVVIDGPAATGSTISHVTLSGADEQKVVIQQSVMLSPGDPRIPQTDSSVTVQSVGS